MAKVLNYESQISQSLVIHSWHVSQSVDAFTGVDAFDITLSGSSTVTGTNIMSSSASPSITSILTENDSHPFITSVTTTGPNFRMNLADEGKGSAYMALGNQTGLFGGTGFTAHYATGSNASEGEIIMSIGKNGDVLDIQDRFIVQSEPGRIATNGNSELTLSVGGPSTGRRQVLGNVQDGTGEFANFAAGIDNEFGRKRFVSFEYSSNSTSSQAGFFSSSLAGTGVPNFNANAIPFGIVAGGSQTADLTNTVFYIDRGGSMGATVPVTASLQISRGGSINMEGDITASGDIIFEGNVSGSGANSSYFGAEYHAHGNDANSGFTLLSLTSKPIISAGIFNNQLLIGAVAEPQIPTKLNSNNVEFAGAITASNNISASGDIIAQTASLQRIELPDNSSIVASNSGRLDFGTSELKLISGDDIFLQLDDTITFSNAETTIPGNINAGGTISNVSTTNVTASGHGLFQAGKPVVTHTTHVTNSLANAGRYHIVGGNLTCSVQELPAVPTGAEFEFFQTSSAGNFLFETGSGTSILSKNGSLRLAQQGSSAVLKKVAGATYHLMGDLT